MFLILIIFHQISKGEPSDKFQLSFALGTSLWAMTRNQETNDGRWLLVDTGLVDTTALYSTVGGHTAAGHFNNCTLQHGWWTYCWTVLNYHGGHIVGGQTVGL